MPFPPPSRTLLGPRRRSLLASAAGAALLVGCSSGADDSGTTGGSASAAEHARARAATDSETLLQRYDAVLAAHPTLADRLDPLRAEVVRHATAFGGGGSGSNGWCAQTWQMGRSMRSGSDLNSPTTAVVFHRP